MIHPDLEHLLTWPDGWNGYDALAPRREAIELASTWLTLYKDIRQEEWDVKPMITGDSDGGVAFWGRAPDNCRHLEIFFDADGKAVEYMQVWDTRDVKCRIDDGDITSEEEYKALWQWLYAKEVQV